MFKKWNRILAFVLSFALVITTFGSDLATVRTYAEDSQEENVEETHDEEEADEASEESEDEDSGEDASEDDGALEDAEDSSGNDDPAQEPAEEAAPAESGAPAEGSAPAEGEAPAQEPAEAAAEEVAPAEVPAEVPAEEPAKPEPKEEKKEGVITVSYKALEGGSVSLPEETVDITAEDPAYQGSTATADEGFAFTGWKDEEGNEVTKEATLIPSDLEKDAVFTAEFEAVAAEEEEAEEEEKEEEIPMPAVTFSKSAGNISVFVDAPEGAFPEKTEMEVTPVYDRDILGTAEEAVDGQAKAISAVDITFTYKGKEIEPKKAIDVKLHNDAIRDAEGIEVVHIDNDGEADIVGSDVKGSSVAFSSDSFSIYVIVETGDDARLYVQFMNGETEIARIAVKKADTEDADNYAAVLYDPGVGTVPEGTSFVGWTTEENYTIETTALTIEDVRDAVKNSLPPANDGDTVTYYAMFVHGYVVNYLGDNDVSLGKEIIELPATTAAGTAMDYKVNMAYTPVDDIHAFQGWMVREGAGNIVGYVPDKAYENGEEIKITGNVTFSVNAPEGHWLVFESNGGTYIAPQFVKTGDVTAAPTLDMLKKGYKFGGWYLTSDLSGNPFVFGKELEQGTTLYAKWDPNDTAPYTIIIWTQGLDSNGKVSSSYSLKDTLVVNDGAVGTNIPYTSVDNGDEDYITVPKGKEGFGHYTGFNLKSSSKDQKVKITPEGDAVLNLYYDRIKYNFRFYYYRIENSQVMYANNSADGRDIWKLVSWHNGSPTSHPVYTGPLPKANGMVSGSDAYYFTLSAHYGENISGDWPTYDHLTGVGNNSPVSFVMMVGTKLKPNPSSGGDGTIKGNIKILDENILGKTNDANGNYVIARFQTYNNWNYHIWYEKVEGIDTHGAQEKTWNKKTYYEKEVVEPRSSNTNVDWQNEPNFTGYKYIGRRNENWTGDSNWTTTTGGQTVYHINYVYDRLQYKIFYQDGAYYDGNGNMLESHGDYNISESAAIAMDAPIPAQYKNYVPTPRREGFVFEGWYSEESCLDANKYVFTTMPFDGIKVHARWRQIEYRVFLHPNAGTQQSDPSLTWGSENQEMNFRIAYGKKISVPTGTRTGYEFVGWYTDEACTKVFSAATVLNETTVKDSYDKEHHFTDPMDKWGNGANMNKDTNRPWITKEFNLYAKWRKVIDGAPGIRVEYSLKDTDTGVTGTGTAIDANIYVDSARVTAVPAVGSSDDDYRFDSWILQKWDGTKFVDEQAVYPGQKFEVDIDKARMTQHQDDNDKDYVIQLRAKFVKKGEPVLTFIPWYKNDGSNYFRLDDDLKINQAVTIPAPPTKPGATFLGWARVDMGSTLADAKNFMADPDNYKQSAGTWIDYTDGQYLKDGKVVTEVAADEKMPYQAMFAVWEQNSFKYTVHYYLDDATKVTKLHDDKVVENIEYGSEFEESAVAVPGYKVVKTKDQNGKVEQGDRKLTVSFKDDPGDKEITFFYAPVSDLTYKVNYLEKGTEKVLAAPDTVENQTYGTTVEVSPDKTKDTELGKNYKRITADPQTLKIKLSGNVVNFYYEKRTDFDYTVHYYQEGTTKNVPGLSDKKVTGKTYNEEYTETAKEAAGWTVVGDTSKTFVLDENHKQIIFYYAERTDYTYKVKYLDKADDSEVADTQIRKGKKLGYEYTETALDLTSKGYDLDKSSEAEQKITVSGDVSKDVVTFYYSKKSNISYTVNYLEKGTEKVLATPDTVENQTYGTTVEVSPDKTKDTEISKNYKRITADPQTLKIKLSGNVVNFYYEKRTDFDYIVHYYQEGTTKSVPGLADKTVTGKTYNAEYYEEAKEAAGWKVVGDTSKTFVLDENHKQIIFYYAEREDYTYTVKYLDKADDSEVADTQIRKGKKLGYEYTEEALDLTSKGYDLDKSSEAEQKITVSGDVSKDVVIFYYSKKSDLTYTVNYLENGTGAVLADPDSVGRQIFGTTVDVYPDKTKDAALGKNYRRITEDPQSLEIKLTGNVVNFYYEKRNDFEYTVHYYQQGTTKSVPGLDDKNVTGKTYNEEYYEEAKEAAGWTVVGDTSKTFVLDVNKKEIIFYYVEREDYIYTVKYLDKADDSEVADTQTRTGNKLGREYTEEALDLMNKGYVLDASSEEEQKITITGDEKKDIIIFYYTKRTDLGYTVHYYEENTTRPVADDKPVTGRTYKEEITEKAIDVEGYKALEPTEQKVVIDVVNEDVIFYYAKRTDLEYTVHYYIENTTTRVKDDKVVENQTFESIVKERPVDVDNYFIIDDSEKELTISADNTKNVIIFYYGKKMSITLIAIGGETDYSAEEHSVEGFTVEAGAEAQGLVGKLTGFIGGLLGTTAHAKDVSAAKGDNTVVIDGKTYTVEGITSGAKRYNAGTTPTEFTGKAQVLLDGKDVTDRFIIYKKDAELVINKRPVLFRSESDSKTYDGRPLTNHYVHIEKAGLAGNDAVEFDVTGSRTRVGWSWNTFGYRFTSGDEDNYIVEKKEGRLTVTGSGGGGPTPDPTLDPTPSDPTPIPDNPTPLVPTPPTGEVLGATRERADAAAVLGARRGRTEDTTNTAGSVLAIIISAACAVSILLFGKKKEEDET